MNVTVSTATGSPVRGAVLTVSNSAAGVVFHTNSAGVLMLTEPVSVLSGTGGGASIRISATANGASGSTSQHLYSSKMQEFCSFKGRPSTDLSALDIAPENGSAFAYFDLMGGIIDEIASKLTRYHTEATGWSVAVPGQRTLYAQIVTLYDGSEVKYSQPAYSHRQILGTTDTPLGALEQAGCSSTALAA